MRYSILRFSKLLLFLTFSTTFLFSQNNKISWSAFNMGYAEVASNNLKVKSVAGQVFVGTARQENNQVISGFLADTLFRSMVVGIKQGDELPTRFLMDQNYPNPFNPTTTIHFELPSASYVTLKIFNILGQEVATLADENKEAGKYNILLDGSQLASGLYFYRLTASNLSSISKHIFTSTKKLLLVK